MPVKNKPAPPERLVILIPKHTAFTTEELVNVLQSIQETPGRHFTFRVVDFQNPGNTEERGGHGKDERVRALVRRLSR